MEELKNVGFFWGHTHNTAVHDIMAWTSTRGSQMSKILKLMALSFFRSSEYFPIPRPWMEKGMAI